MYTATEHDKQTNGPRREWDPLNDRHLFFFKLKAKRVHAEFAPDLDQALRDLLASQDVSDEEKQAYREGDLIFDVDLMWREPEGTDG